MKYAIEMAAGGMIYIPSFTMSISSVQKWGGVCIYMHTVGCSKTIS
jgi:hypothetical protein